MFTQRSWAAWVCPTPEMSSFSPSTVMSPQRVIAAKAREAEALELAIAAQREMMARLRAGRADGLHPAPVADRIHRRTPA